MSWHYSLALEAAFSEAYSSAGVPSAPWRSMPTALDDSCSDRMKGTCHRSPFGMMFVPSTDAHGEALLTWFLAGFPARTSVRLDNARGLMASTLDCGERWLASFPKPGRSLYSSKIRRIFELADLSECSKTLTAWGTTRRGVCLERKIVELHTRANECGLLPTPTTVGNEMSPSMQKWPAHQRLMELLGRFKNSHLKSLPTPTATRYGSTRGGANGRKGEVRPSLEALTGGPWISFREWMMAWPLGWSGSEPLATDRFQQWFDWHGRRLDHGYRDHK